MLATTTTKRLLIPLFTFALREHFTKKVVQKIRLFIRVVPHRRLDTTPLHSFLISQQVGEQLNTLGRQNPHITRFPLIAVARVDIVIVLIAKQKIRALIEMNFRIVDVKLVVVAKHGVDAIVLNV